MRVNIIIFFFSQNLVERNCEVDCQSHNITQT